MTDTEQRKAAQSFADYWKDKGYEKGESQKFWLALLRNVYGVEQPEQYISFEEQVKLDHTSFIDGSIPATHVLIEQKSSGKNLREAIKQSDGSRLTPFQQAQRYSMVLPYSQRPRWIITCNFQEFLIYDMEKPTGEPEQVLLANLPKALHQMDFLVQRSNTHIQREVEVSMDAGRIVGQLYDAFQKQYKDPESKETLKNLNILCVRLVFCLYAEDAGIFGRHSMFHDYLAQFETRQMRRALIDLFRVLDQKPEQRDPYLSEDNPALAEFPYVNGGLFANEQVEVPPFTDEIRDLLLINASQNFDWSVISPTIFGAVFESTLNPETRRSGGMHYTSIENIHKVIDPLFLDDLKVELEQIAKFKTYDVKKKRLEQYQEKLAGLTFLDPACGSGNFLTETYLSLRRLENQALSMIHRDQIAMDMDNPIKVSISQFYGIEINDFAVTVAKTALWIAESQMMKETESIINMNLDFLPLKTNATIVEGNALRLDWESVVPKNQLNYIMGNPPFVGARMMDKEQKSDVNLIFEGFKNAGNLDYVSAWYKKAADMMKGTNIRSAFVSTNSITQGEQPAILWKPLMESGIKIDFAHRTFQWDSEAKIKAHVHCVIIGFSRVPVATKRYLYLSNELCKEVQNINAYLVDAPDIFVHSQKKSLCNTPHMEFGSMPNDGGYLSDYSESDYQQIILQYPMAKKYFKRFLGATEFLHNKQRWCIWLEGSSSTNIRKIPPIMSAVQKVYENRVSSNRVATKKLATTPTLFGEIRQPKESYLIVPRHSSQNRRYIPLGYVSPDTICGDANLLIPNASLYSFGVLTSNVHMAWMRTICGRIKSDYRYSASLVYNTFPWCNPTPTQKAKIEKTAQAILDARANHPDCSLADLYDELTMPPDLRTAHQRNDKAVMQAYGFPIKGFTESDCVAELMKLYQKLVDSKG